VTGSQSEGRKRTAKSSKIVKKVWIRASKDVVYRALTESKELGEWFCDRATLDPREGGELTAYWKGGKTGQKGRAVITRMVPGSALELLWIEEGDDARKDSATHTSCYEIRVKSGMTELVMTDNDPRNSDDEETAILDQGWNLVLGDLRDHCECHERSAKLHASGSRTRNTSSG
jgi:uncharacterized protein YndB with AHSA1/START domain